jgi:hypothetical protein
MLRSKSPRLLLGTLAALLLTVSARGQSLDPLLAREDLWKLNPENFQRATQGLPFQWTSGAKDSARAAEPSLTLMGQKVYEVVARFEQEQLREISASFYARGDAGPIEKEPFDGLVRQSAQAVSQWSGAKFTPRGKDPTSAVRAEGLLWETAKAGYLLEYSFTREVKSRDIAFRAEFVRLEITPPKSGAGGSLAGAGRAGSLRGKFAGGPHVRRDAGSGDVWLHDVPMVDQGEKGYCVVASTERVLRYYGNPVDANELAQIANSDAKKGTDFEAMFNALKKVSGRLGIRVKVLEEQSVRSVLEMIKDYNRIAKREQARQLPQPGPLIDVGALYASVDFSVLRTVRTRNPADTGRFQRTVQSQIEQGYPLLWCVQLGLNPEPRGSQNAGGHMRLIIGYNLKTREILYSDSWGAGHELKRMGLDDAWAISTGLATVEPL